ncbi:MAG TPA: tetratricopeptide repeat protein [Bosea sp. (in: a-proteobacteria)]
MFRVFALVIAVAVLSGSHETADARPALSQAVQQCLAAAGVIHDRKDGRPRTIEPRVALPPCRAAQPEAAQAPPVVRFAVGQGMMTSTDPREVQDGVALIERAAAEGLPQAQFRLGALYEQGFFKHRDRCTEFNECRARDRRQAEEALKYYALAAPGYGHAASAMGYAHYYGAYGARRDLAKAFEYLTRAAEAGVPAAMRLLGPMYMSAHGAPMDKVRGLELVGLAAQMGDRQA